jgi:hypothetical protein
MRQHDIIKEKCGKLRKEIREILEEVDQINPHTPYYNLLIDDKLARLYEIQTIVKILKKPRLQLVINN